MTRAEKVAEAQGLRAQGLSVREIAEQMGVAKSTAGAYLTDPHLTKLRARKDGYARPCPRCGTPMDGSGGLSNHPELCGECRVAEPHTVQEAVRHAESHRGKAWSDDALLDLLRSFYEEHGSFTMKMWTRESPKRGLPSAPTIINRFGSWNDAKRRAKIPVESPRRSNYRRIPVEDLLAGIRKAGEIVHGIPSAADYRAIRACYPELGLASDTLIRIRLGGWSDALTLAFEGDSLDVAA